MANIKMILDNDEKKYVRQLLEKRQRADLRLMHSLFVKHYCKLIDSTIRKHYYLLCLKCNGSIGEHFHICEDQTASIFGGIGPRVLEVATQQEKDDCWKAFLKDVQQHDVFKRIIINWMKEFTCVKNEIDKDWDMYYVYLTEHFPNFTKNPHQVITNDDESLSEQL